MGRFDSIKVYNTIIDQGLVPVFYTGDYEEAKNIVSAIAKGGGKIIEFTNRGDFAYKIFSKLVRHFELEEPQLIFGVGSVIDAYTASLYINNGANFVVGPSTSPEIARLCNRRRVPYSPGCGTATEISKAEELGCEIIKVFPASILGGPGFVKSILAPCPWTKIMPTGGVDVSEESIKAWFEAGVVALGVGSSLITKKLVAAKDWEAISENVREALTLIQEYKNP